MSIELPRGRLNEVAVVEGPKNKLLVSRSPQSPVEVQRTLCEARSELIAQGFTFDQIRLRSFTEQVDFSERLRQIGFPTPPASLGKEGEQLVEYIPGTEKLFDLWLKQDPRAAYATPKTIQALMLAHTENLVVGDRTGKNELVTADAEVALIDFDFQLLGPYAREFDIATLMYRVSRAAHRGNPRQLPVLGEIYKDILSSRQVEILYDREVLLRYMNRFVELSSEEGRAALPYMTPTIRPQYSAELFDFLIDVLKCSLDKFE